MRISGLIIYEIDGSRIHKPVECLMQDLPQEILSMHDLMCTLALNRPATIRDDQPLTGSITVDVGSGKKDSISFKVDRDDVPKAFPKNSEKLLEIMDSSYLSDTEDRTLEGSINVIFKQFSSGMVRFSGIRSAIEANARSAIDQIITAIEKI